MHPKIDNLIIESLGFIPRIRSAGHLLLLVSQPSSWSVLRRKFLLPTSSWEDPSQWASILPSPAVSCYTSQLTHFVVVPLVCSSSAKCLHFLRIVLSEFLGRLHTENRLLQAGQFFTFCLKQVHKQTLCIGLKTQYRTGIQYRQLASLKMHRSRRTGQSPDEGHEQGMTRNFLEKSGSVLLWLSLTMRNPKRSTKPSKVTVGTNDIGQRRTRSRHSKTTRLVRPPADRDVTSGKREIGFTMWDWDPVIKSTNT